MGFPGRIGQTVISSRLPCARFGATIPLPRLCAASNSAALDAHNAVNVLSRMRKVCEFPPPPSRDCAPFVHDELPLKFVPIWKCQPRLKSATRRHARIYKKYQRCQTRRCPARRRPGQQAQKTRGLSNGPIFDPFTHEMPLCGTPQRIARGRAREDNVRHCASRRNPTGTRQSRPMPSGMLDCAIVTDPAPIRVRSPEESCDGNLMVECLCWRSWWYAPRSLTGPQRDRPYRSR